MLYRGYRGVDLVKDGRIQLSVEATLVLEHNITYPTGHERVFYLRTPDNAASVAGITPQDIIEAYR